MRKIWSSVKECEIRNLDENPDPLDELAAISIAEKS